MKSFFTDAIYREESIILHIDRDAEKQQSNEKDAPHHIYAEE